MMSLPVYAIAIDYDRYAILKYCILGSKRRKSIPFKYFHILQIDPDKWVQVTMAWCVLISGMRNGLQYVG
jgi:hypothetical protein